MTAIIRQQRTKNETIMASNIEQFKSIKSPDVMFKKNFTPLAQHLEMAEELQNAYKANRGIEKGFDKLITAEYMQMNVFKKNRLVQRKKNQNYSTDYAADSVFMTSLLKNSNQKQVLQ